MNILKIFKQLFYTKKINTHITHLTKSNNSDFTSKAQKEELLKKFTYCIKEYSKIKSFQTAKDVEISNFDFNFYNTLEPGTIIFSIKFGKSKSKYYDDAVKTAKQLPHFLSIDTNINYNECNFFTLEEITENLCIISDLMFFIQNWRSLNISVYNKNISIKQFYDVFLYELIDYAKEAKLDIISFSFGDNSVVTEKDLPLPIVYYPPLWGAFFAFAESKHSSQIFLCNCTKKPIENYLLLKNSVLNSYECSPLNPKLFPSAIIDIVSKNTSNPLSALKFRDGLCHKCNHITPRLRYHERYLNSFAQRYGWFISQKFFELGIYPQIDSKLIYLKDSSKNLPPDEFDKILKKDYSSAESFIKAIKTFVENLTREEFGHKKIGDAWVHETILFNIVKEIFPDEEILRHYRPKWLDKLELDIYIPNLKIGIEYQGEQHYIPVEHWGGEFALERQKERDKRKAELCNINNITLLHIKYDEPLTKSYIEKLINSVI